MQSYLFPQIIADHRIDSYVTALQLLKESDSIIFKFHSQTELSPAGLAILACICDAALEMERQVKWEIPKQLARKQRYLKQLQDISQGYKSLPQPSVYNLESRDILFRGCRNALDLGFMENFEAKFQLGDDLLFDCRLILQELMQNTMTHSGAERYFIYAGLWEDEIHLGVLDMGVGIPAKMRQKYTKASDVDYLLLAMEEGITTRREKTGGLGLYYFCHFLKRNRGKLTLVSGNAQVRFYFITRKSQKSLLKYYLPGTWCFARIPLKAGRRKKS